jgi:hypothetical protein
MNRLKNIYNLGAVLFLALALMLPAMAGTFRRESDDKKTPKLPKGMDIYPLELIADKVVVPEKYPLAVIGKPAEESYKKVLPDAPLDSSGQFRESYQVQIFTSKLYGPAMKEFNVASEIFDQTVRMDYEVPYYKIRVGDFPTRERAEAYLKVVKAAGYDVTWVVRVNVNIKSVEEHSLIGRPASDTTGTNVPESEPDNAADKNR